ncbi:unnamed protein product [Vitrella brassicaformis CCMP3155]|uniref:Uncharacterized protein n=1 Tax=Vitrella brassicaformis (strain CCMP3155) TaxID=1169540 RepID=A0A0G4EXV9_VITBC|nr:unnamed protein product [Vitrella brassicaformis CCMP3155]|eukprot:CEM03706.1 unnamed protein product [Vitrella brassicaformis CCMP3155]
MICHEEPWASLCWSPSGENYDSCEDSSCAVDGGFGHNEYNNGVVSGVLQQIQTGRAMSQSAIKLTSAANELSGSALAAIDNVEAHLTAATAGATGRYSNATHKTQECRVMFKADVEGLDTTKDVTVYYMV